MVEKNIEAVIDLGTNTFNLLIGEYSGTFLSMAHSEKIPVMLGMGGINEGIIAQDAMERAKSALKQFKTKCDEYNATSIKGVGTSALRAAVNSQELVDFAKTELGISIKIVSGIEEAELIYNGVKLTHDFNGPSLIMDIGGGSTEFILADENGILKIASYNIGVSRLFQLLDQPEQFDDELVDQVITFIEKNTNGFFGETAVDTLIGSSGSFETIYDMINECEFPKEGKSLEVEMEALNELLDWLTMSSLEERLDNPWIVPIRKKMLPISAIKIKWVVEKMKINKLFISPYSLKEGVFSLNHE